MKRFLILLGLCLLLCGCACAQQERPVFVLPAGDGHVQVRTEIIDEELWLFLPAFAQQETMYVEGAQLDWWGAEPDEDGLMYVDILYGEDDLLEITVMQSQNLRALFLFSDDPENAGRAYVEESPTHDHYAAGSLALVDAQGQVNHARQIRSLRGRGNWTWSWDKRPYQIKLEEKADLLDTGDNANRARNWVLLAEALDSTLLHNRITFDLAAELGLNAPQSEFVDLYYDGEYRGTYLLCEKVEVGEGRVNVLDYDNLLETWNRSLGQYDLELLEAAEDENCFGNRYAYIQGVVDNPDPSVGGYLVEMEYAPITLSDRCWFELENSGDFVYALKNPENASQNMVRYISEHLQKAQSALRTGGDAEAFFDLDAYARTLLLQELSYNVDGYTYSSAYFVLPEGETRFEPGPVWDFDLSYRYRRDGTTEGAAGFKDQSGWLTDFYQYPAFLEKARQIYAGELYPLIRDILLGDGEGAYLQSLNAYRDLLDASARMNLQRWGVFREGRFYYGDTWEDELTLLRKFLMERAQWLQTAFSSLQEDSLPLWMDVRYCNPDDSVRFLTAPWQGVSAQAVSAVQLTQATQEEYARWQVEAIVSAADGASLEGRRITVNGTPVTAQMQQDGTLLIRLSYEDHSYRPLDYYGDDVGRIYDHDRYTALYPDVAEACGYDPEAIMDYFFDEGVKLGHLGNGFFDPRELARLNPWVEEYLYDDWASYYWEFLYGGYDSDWLDQTGARFLPPVTDVP